MSRFAQVATGVAGGAIAWTLTEYAVHRWLLHGPFGQRSERGGLVGRIPIGGIHRNHHRDPNWSVVWGRAAGHLAMAATGAAGTRVALAIAPRLPTVLTVAAGATWSAGYSTYDIVHHHLHHRAPRTRLGVHMRQRHFRHHFAGARTNLGVTTGIWDRLFGTEADPRPVRLPAATAPWWLDALGDEFSTRAQSRHAA